MYRLQAVTKGMLCFCVALFMQASCATEGDDDTDVVGVQSQGLAGRPSFLSTCEGGFYEVDSPNHPTAFTFAFADSCRKANGKSTGFPPPSWSGICRDDIANCNGRLICGRC
jgi:hypothetical protein